MFLSWTHDSSSIVLDSSKKLSVGPSLENEIPNHLVTRLDLLSTGRKRSVGGEAEEVDVLESWSRILLDEGLDVPLDETSEVEVGDVVSGGWGRGGGHWERKEEGLLAREGSKARATERKKRMNRARRRKPEPSKVPEEVRSRPKRRRTERRRPGVEVLSRAKRRPEKTENEEKA